MLFGYLGHAKQAQHRGALEPVRRCSNGQRNFNSELPTGLSIACSQAVSREPLAGTQVGPSRQAAKKCGHGLERH
jgi:hypothetical protein